MLDATDRALMCVEGYLQLGLVEDAWRELDQLPAEGRERPAALRLEVAVLVALKQWEGALGCSERLIATDPGCHQGYLHVSFCLHELGRTREARDRLLSAPVFVTDQALYHYNLACYETQLRNPDEAEHLLRIAFKKDATLYRAALLDGDLAPIREMVKAMGSGAVTFEDGTEDAES